MDLGLRVEDLGFKALVDLGFKALGLGFRGWGVGGLGSP